MVLGRTSGEGCPWGDGGSRSEVQQNQLLGTLQVRQRGTGLKLHLLKQKPNRTSSLTGLASDLLLMLPTSVGRTHLRPALGSHWSLGTSAPGVIFLSHTPNLPLTAALGRLKVISEGSLNSNWSLCDL